MASQAGNGGGRPSAALRAAAAQGMRGRPTPGRDVGGHLGDEVQGREVALPPLVVSLFSDPELLLSAWQEQHQGVSLMPTRSSRSRAEHQRSQSVPLRPASGNGHEVPRVRQFQHKKRTPGNTRGGKRDLYTNMKTVKPMRLHCLRHHQRGHPAPLRHEGIGHDRGDQLGPKRPDVRRGALRHRRRPLPGDTGDGETAGERPVGNPHHTNLAPRVRFLDIRPRSRWGHRGKNIGQA